MRHSIETVPRDGKVVILEDDALGVYAIAYWSPEDGDWVRENGEPSTITPTHWYPATYDSPRLQDNYGSNAPSQIEPSASWVSRSTFFPFSSRRAKTQPAASETIALQPDSNAAYGGAIEAEAKLVTAKRGPQMRRRFAYLAITIALVGTALIGMSFHADVVVYLKQYAGQLDSLRGAMTGRLGIVQEPPSHHQVSQKAVSLTPDIVVEQRAEADLTSAGGENSRQATEASASARQSPEWEQRAKTLSDELAKAEHTIDARNLELRELTNQLAIARRDVEQHAALSSKAAGETAQLKQVAASTATLARELASELAMARREVESHVALSSKTASETAQLKQAAANNAALVRELVSELTMARREIETHATKASKASDELERIKQVAERSTAELRGLLQRERDRSTALAEDLTLARHEIETHLVQASKTADEVAQLRQAAEGTAELRESLQRDHDRVAAIELDLETTRRTADPSTVLEPSGSSQTSLVKSTAASTAGTQDNPHVARLLARASALLDQGNIGAARTLLEHAADAGSARASFVLAETYDPFTLSAWGTHGTRGDTTKAREFYERASAGGVQEANDRLNALQQ